MHSSAPDNIYPLPSANQCVYILFVCSLRTQVMFCSIACAVGLQFTYLLQDRREAYTATGGQLRYSPRAAVINNIQLLMNYLVTFSY